MLRRIVASISLVLAVYCLVTAAATLYAQTVPDQPDPEKLAKAPRHPWPLLIPLIFLGFVLVAAIVLHGRRRRTTRNSRQHRVDER